jgi:hypothetical protein
MEAAMKAVLLAVAVWLGSGATAASAQTGEYASCEVLGDALIIAVSGASCGAARAVALALAAAPAADSEVVLRAAGWTPLRAASTDTGNAYDLVATRRRASLRIRRPGIAPDLDGWAAGRELLFSRGTLVGGKPPPKGSVLCTSAFLIRLSGRLGGLSAAHCGAVRSDRTTHRRNAALRRPPQPGIVVGRVRRNLERASPIDALVVPVPSGPARPSADVVDRGVARPPWFVVGRARPLLGRRVCFTGRTSGVDQCGRITGDYHGRLPRTRLRFPRPRLRCTTITAREGDSGGPVYTVPRRDGTVRAVGITTLVYGLLQTMCFTPLEPVLHALHATLVTAGAS